MLGWEDNFGAKRCGYDVIAEIAAALYPEIVLNYPNPN